MEKEQTQKVAVRVRIRPGKRESACLAVEGTDAVRFTDGPTRTELQFDKVYGQDSTQAAVFEDCGRVVDVVLNGCNAAILAYGQTSAGKTHTLVGAVRDPEQQGVVPRAIARLGQGIAVAATQQGGAVFKVTVSIVEIYCERLRCLLDGGAGGKDNLQIKTDALRGTYVEGATEVEVCDEAELEALMTQGLAGRSVAATAMNAESSRSHCVVTIRVEQSIASGEARLGKLVLVDLAGSERVGKTGAQQGSSLLAEGALINKSLSCLANVIYALTETPSAAGGAPRHVPYRDSKLTRLLQDSLGGTASTVLICCCSPDPDNASETMSTLRFGSRAKGLTCKLQVNQRLSAERLQQLLVVERAAKEALAAEVQQLIKQLDKAGGDLANALHTGRDLHPAAPQGHLAHPSTTAAAPPLPPLPAPTSSASSATATTQPGPLETALKRDDVGAGGGMVAQSSLLSVWLERACAVLGGKARVRVVLDVGFGLLVALSVLGYMWAEDVWLGRRGIKHHAGVS